MLSASLLMLLCMWLSMIYFSDGKLEEKHLCNQCCCPSSHSNLEASHVPEQIIPSNTPVYMLFSTHFLLASHHFTSHGVTLELLHLEKSEQPQDFQRLCTSLCVIFSRSLIAKDLIPLLLTLKCLIHSYVLFVGPQSVFDTGLYMSSGGQLS